MLGRPRSPILLVCHALKTLLAAVENSCCGSRQAMELRSTQCHCPLGFYITAQAKGLAVLNGVINHAVQANKTTVHGGATVTASGTRIHSSTLRDELFQCAGRPSLLLSPTRVSDWQEVYLCVDGAEPKGPIPLQFISGVGSAEPDASLKNSNTISEHLNSDC